MLHQSLKLKKTPYYMHKNAVVKRFFDISSQSSQIYSFFHIFIHSFPHFCE